MDGILGDALKIRLQAPPVEGKANKALIKFLAQEWGVPTRQLTILSGESHRMKRVRVQGLTRAALLGKLEILATTVSLAGQARRDPNGTYLSYFSIK